MFAIMRIPAYPPNRPAVCLGNHASPIEAIAALKAVREFETMKPSIGVTDAAERIYMTDDGVRLDHI